MVARKVELSELSERERLQLARGLLKFFLALGATKIEVLRNGNYESMDIERPKR
jgi:hypothetical protein